MRTIEDFIEENPNIKSFIASNPSREELANVICYVANNNVLEIDETWAWEVYHELGGFAKDDFYDDVQGTFNFYGQEALEMYGIVNWRLKNSEVGGIYNN